jgi:hypothetical protein
MGKKRHLELADCQRRCLAKLSLLDVVVPHCLLKRNMDVLDFLCHFCTSIVSNKVNNNTTYHRSNEQNSTSSSTGSITICMKYVSEEQLVAEISIEYKT